MSDDPIDMKEVMERVQDDRELLMELLDIYIEDFGGKRGPLTQAIEKKDADQVKNISHSLKGASGNIAAKKLHQSFISLEQMAKNNDFSQAKDLLTVIDQQFSELQNYCAGLKNK